MIVQQFYPILLKVTAKLRKHNKCKAKCIDLILILAKGVLKICFQTEPRFADIYPGAPFEKH